MPLTNNALYQVCVPAWRLWWRLRLGGSGLVGEDGFGEAGAHPGAGGPGGSGAGAGGPAEGGTVEEAPGGAGRAARRLPLQDGGGGVSLMF